MITSVFTLLLLMSESVRDETPVVVTSTWNWSTDSDATWYSHTAVQFKLLVKWNNPSFRWVFVFVVLITHVLTVPRRWCPGQPSKWGTRYESLGRVFLLLSILSRPLGPGRNSACHRRALESHLSESHLDVTGSGCCRGEILCQWCIGPYTSSRLASEPKYSAIAEAASRITTKAPRTRSRHGVLVLLDELYLKKGECTRSISHSDPKERLWTR